MKLFASDYDGTYWKHTFKGQVDLVKNIKQTKQWREEGNLFVFATGRPISMMRLEKYMHGIVYDYIVGLNGGIIISKTGDILFRETINNSIARKIMILIQQKEVLHYSVSDGLCGHYHTAFGWSHKTFYGFAFFKLFLKTYGLTLDEALNRPVVQISVKLKSADEASSFAHQMNQLFGKDIVAFSNLRHVDIAARGLSKATGIEYIANRHGIDANDIYCMGDSFNDLPMLKRYHGFTLPEAHQTIKENVRGVFETVGDALTQILKG